MRFRLITAAAVIALGLGGAIAAAGPAASLQGSRDRDMGGWLPLPLGPAGTTQTQSSMVLEPGVTLTTIVRGAFDAGTPWVVEVSIPATSSSPDPDASPRSVQDLTSAEALAQRLTAAGFAASAQPVLQPAVADVPAGVIGYRVRLEHLYPSKDAADAAVAALKAVGFSSRSWYAGWDGSSASKGQWTVNVVTIDPRTFRGQLGGTFGPTLQDRETTSALSRSVGAKAAVNGGYFVLDPAAGAPGDPAGAGVYGGVLESETTAGRPALELHVDARHTDVVRPTWTGTLRTSTGQLTLDGLNRVPGLIRNCGGDPTDLPTAAPLHDITCTDPAELVAFTTAFGPATPAGAGAEAVLDRQDRVVSVSTHRGTTLTEGQRSVQGTGALAATLTSLHPGQPAPLRLRMTADGATVLRPGTTVINGAPQLLRNGASYITQARDGMVHPGDPSFAYGFVLQRNPRTFAGVDATGRTLLITVDGRQLDQLGLSIPEEAAVAQALGLRNAINLDGGGSTTLAVDGNVVNHPSDAAGERPVGDAIYVR